MSSTFNPPNSMVPSNVICGPGELLQSENPTAALTCTGMVKVLATCFCACAGKAHARPTDNAINMLLLFILMVLLLCLFVLQDLFPHRSLSAAPWCLPSHGSTAL